MSNPNTKFIKDLKNEQIRTTFINKGYIVIKNFFTDNEYSTLKKVTQSIQRAPEKKGGIMKYFEKSNISAELLLNRAENFIQYFDQLSKIIFSTKIMDLLRAAGGQEFHLFKEKINFKLIGGGGFKIHQDAPAFTKFCREELLILMIPVDKSTYNNGALKVCDNFFEPKIVPHDNGEAKVINRKINWKTIELKPKDIVVFSSFLLHYSEDNNSKTPRRCYYFTFNSVANGNLRDEYFSYKRSHFPPRVERNVDVDYTNWKTQLAKDII